MRSLRFSATWRGLFILWVLCLTSWSAESISRGQEVVDAGATLPTVEQATTSSSNRNTESSPRDSDFHFEGLPTAVFSGGCFWTMEAEFEKLPGVVDVLSGYTGGKSKSPTYKTYASKGHREAVWVRYDPKRITYQGLVEFFLKRIDPHDLTGSFVDRGRQYGPAIYVGTEEERESANKVIDAIERARVFRRPLRVPILERPTFWPAEDVHQNFALRNPVQYAAYRSQCGRDEFIAKTWGAEAFRLSLPGAFPTPSVAEASGDSSRESSQSDAELEQQTEPWLQFQKPSRAELKRMLTRLQFQVTQENHTELQFSNKYWNHHQKGIYVDIVSGEPLFSSTAKFDSGTGWPSFVRPIDESLIVYRIDQSVFPARVEVRSKYGDSHLGHVFGDGPPAAGGRRFCINSAALRFIPLEKMLEEGYASLLKEFEGTP